MTNNNNFPSKSSVSTKISRLRDQYLKNLKRSNNQEVKEIEEFFEVDLRTGELRLAEKYKNCFDKDGKLLPDTLGDFPRKVAIYVDGKRMVYTLLSGDLVEKGNKKDGEKNIFQTLIELAVLNHCGDSKNFMPKNDIRKGASAVFMSAVYLGRTYVVRPIYYFSVVGPIIGYGYKKSKPALDRFYERNLKERVDKIDHLIAKNLIVSHDLDKVEELEGLLEGETENRFKELFKPFDPSNKHLDIASLKIKDFLERGSIRQKGWRKIKEFFSTKKELDLDFHPYIKVKFYGEPYSIAIADIKQKVIDSIPEYSTLSKEDQQLRLDEGVKKEIENLYIVNLLTNEKELITLAKDYNAIGGTLSTTSFLASFANTITGGLFSFLGLIPTICGPLAVALSQVAKTVSQRLDKIEEKAAQKLYNRLEKKLAEVVGQDRLEECKNTYTRTDEGGDGTFRESKTYGFLLEELEKDLRGLDNQELSENVAKQIVAAQEAIASIRVLNERLKSIKEETGKIADLSVKASAITTTGGVITTAFPGLGVGGSVASLCGSGASLSVCFEMSHLFNERDRLNEEKERLYEVLERNFVGLSKILEANAPTIGIVQQVENQVAVKKEITTNEIIAPKNGELPTTSPLIITKENQIAIPLVPCVEGVAQPVM